MATIDLLEAVPGPANNPYNVTGREPQPNSHGIQRYFLERDKSNTKADYLVTGGNEYYDNVTFEAALLSYDTPRILIFETDRFHETYSVPIEYFSPDYEKQFREGLFFNHLGFQVSFKDTFFFRLYDKDTKKDYLTTEGLPFLAMKYFMQIGFKVESQKLFGLGERTRDFQL